METKVKYLLDKLKKCRHDDIKDLLAQILGKDEEDEGGEMFENSKLGVSAMFNSQTNMSFKLNDIVNQASKNTNKATSNIKLKNRRTNESLGFGNAWAFYVRKVSTSRYVRELNNKEQNEVADFVYETLTKDIAITDDEYSKDKLNIYSMKKFIANSIDYACDCEKETWTVYLVIFIFKLHANILKK